MGNIENGVNVMLEILGAILVILIGLFLLLAMPVWGPPYLLGYARKYITNPVVKFIAMPILVFLTLFTMPFWLVIKICDVLCPEFGPEI